MVSSPKPLILSTVASTMLIAATTVTHAAPASPWIPTDLDPGVEMTILGQSDIHKLTPAEITRNPLASKRRSAYIATEAKHGSRLQSDDVDVFLVNEEAAGGSHIMAVVPKGDVLDSVVLQRPTQRAEGDDTVWVGAKFVNHSNPSSVEHRDAGLHDEITNPKFAIREGRNCRKLYHDPRKIWPEDDTVYDCWEKWYSQRDRRSYGYNRYATFTPARGRTGIQANLIDDTIRFRPWKGKMNVRVGPVHYSPPPSSDCTSTGFSLPLRGGASLSIPVVYCDSHTRLSLNHERHEMGVIWEAIAQNQHRVDAVASFDTSSPSLTMSDYVWFIHTSCPAGPWSCRGAGTIFAKLSYKWTDGGW